MFIEIFCCTTYYGQTHVYMYNRTATFWVLMELLTIWSICSVLTTGGWESFRGGDFFMNTSIIDPCGVWEWRLPFNSEIDFMTGCKDKNRIVHINCKNKWLPFRKTSFILVKVCCSFTSVNLTARIRASRTFWKENQHKMGRMDDSLT